jgi:serine/threonine-protein kinase
MGRKVLAQRYELGAPIARSSMAQVVAARDLESGREVVVKTLPPSLRASRDATQRLEREARALQAIDSPYVCRALDYGLEDRPYLVLELLRGESLAARLEREGRMAPGETARIAADVLSGLEAAHARGIVHRDLKPANVFLADSGVKLLDFGVARVGDDASLLTTAGTTLGSLAYVAPEQIHDSVHATARADLYALGTIVFRALAGRLPFQVTSAEMLVGLKLEVDVPSLGAAVGGVWPASLESWLARLVARLPEGRPESATLARAELVAATRW